MKLYMTNKRTKIYTLLALLLAITPITYADNYNESTEVQTFTTDLVENNGFAEEQLTALFSKVKKQQAILDLIAKPAEKAKLWKEYRPIFMTEQRVNEGVTFWKNNQEALERAEKTYGVPPQIVVAIIGVETFYGRNMGSWPVMDALTTLGFDYPPRSDFFRRQLKEYLLMTREEQLDPLTLKGSYAGAMGMAQFMPGSFRAYAVDFDNDGHIDIWNNPTDAIGSVANYFKEHGWQSQQTVVVQAKVTGDKVTSVLSTGLELDRTIAKLTQAGWSLPKTIPDNTPVMAFKLDGEAGDEYWVGLNNFQVITRYNRSVMYSLVVYQLSEQLLAAKLKND